MTEKTTELNSLSLNKDEQNLLNILHTNPNSKLAKKFAEFQGWSIYCSSRKPNPTGDPKSLSSRFPQNRAGRSREAYENVFCRNMAKYTFMSLNCKLQLERIRDSQDQTLKSSSLSQKSKDNIIQNLELGYDCIKEKNSLICNNLGNLWIEANRAELRALWRQSLKKKLEEEAQLRSIERSRRLRNLRKNLPLYKKVGRVIKNLFKYIHL